MKRLEIRCEKIPIPATFLPKDRVCWGGCGEEAGFALKAIGYLVVYACCGKPNCVIKTEAAMEKLIKSNLSDVLDPAFVKRPWSWFADKPKPSPVNPRLL